MLDFHVGGLIVSCGVLLVVCGDQIRMLVVSDSKPTGLETKLWKLCL